MTTDLRHGDLTEKIIGAAYKAHNTLGFGFLEKVYENALAVELERGGLQVEQQSSVQVTYQGQLVGDYVADLIVEASVIVEVKAVAALERVHEVQLVNYLKATSLKVGLLINFGRKVQVKRRMFG